MIRPELTPPPPPSGRSGIRAIPAIARRRLPMVTVDDQMLHVDRVGLAFPGRRWAISDTPNAVQVGQAGEWLNECQPIATPNFNSYALKHCVEQWAGCYCSNGSFILACYLAGLSIRRQRWDSPNLLVGVSIRWLRSREESKCLGLWTSSVPMLSPSDW